MKLFNKLNIIYNKSGFNIANVYLTNLNINNQIKRISYDYSKISSIINKNLNKYSKYSFSKANKQQQQQQQPPKNKTEDVSLKLKEEQLSSNITNKDAFHYSFNVNRPEFKLYEDQTQEDKDLNQRLKNKEISLYFGGNQYLNKWKKATDWEFLAKRMRRTYLNSGHQSKHPVIIPVKRIRNNLDNFIDLARRKKEIVAVINARDEFPEMQVVIDLKYIQRLEKKKKNFTKFYIFKFANGDKIKCLYEASQVVNILPNTPIKAFFNRFVYGKPNLLNMPIVISGLEKNLYYNNNDSAQFRDIEKFKVWTLNDEIPCFLEVPVDFVGPFNPIKVRELEQYLPPHMHMHKEVIRLYNFNVFALEYNENFIFTDRELPIDLDDSEKEYKDNMNESNTRVQDTSSINTTKVKSENKNKKVPLIPFRVASGKVFAATKDRGSDVNSIKEYLKNQQLNIIKEGKKKKKKAQSDDSDLD